MAWCCSCYYSRASIARQEIRKLNTERKNYENLSKDIQTAIDALNKYASFLRSLGEQCKYICVTGEPYDLGMCATYATSIENLVDSTLTPMKTSSDQAMEDIDDEKEVQQRKIDNTFYCRTCYEKNFAVAME